MPREPVPRAAEPSAEAREFREGRQPGPSCRAASTCGPGEDAISCVMHVSSVASSIIGLSRRVEIVIREEEPVLAAQVAGRARQLGGEVIGGERCRHARTSSESRDEAAQRQVRHDGEEHRRDEGLPGIHEAHHDDLIHHVENQARARTPCRRSSSRL